MPLLSQSAYARNRKISRQRVWQLIKAGRIHLVNGLIDVEQADASLQQKPSRTRKRASNDGVVFVQKALRVRVRKQEWSYGCDRCTIPIPIASYTPLPARLICPNCGAEMTVVDLAELKRK